MSGVQHHCIRNASEMHQKCVRAASRVRYQRCTSAIGVEHNCIRSASRVYLHCHMSAVGGQLDVLEPALERCGMHRPPWLRMEMLGAPIRRRAPLDVGPCVGGGGGGQQRSEAQSARSRSSKKTVHHITPRGGGYRWGTDAYHTNSRDVGRGVITNMMSTAAFATGSPEEEGREAGGGG